MSIKDEVDSQMKMLFLTFILISCSVTTAFASSYEFVVSCKDGYKTILVIKYGDIDPGKEYARVTAAKKLAPFHDNACSASDYNSRADCLDCPREEFEAATLSGDELQRLGSGDLTVIPEVAVGVPLRTIENVGDEIGRIGKKLGF